MMKISVKKLIFFFFFSSLLAISFVKADFNENDKWSTENGENSENDGNEFPDFKSLQNLFGSNEITLPKEFTKITEIWKGSSVNKAAELVEDLSLNYVLSGKETNSLDWIKDLLTVYYEKTIVMYDENTKGEMNKVKQKLKELGAKVDGAAEAADVLFVNLGATGYGRNDIRVAQMKKSIKDWLKAEWKADLPAVFMRDVYIQDVGAMMNDAQTKLGDEKKLKKRKVIHEIEIKTKYDVLRLYVKTISVKYFLEKILTKKKDMEGNYMVILGSWSNINMWNAYNTIFSLAPLVANVKTVDIDDQKLYANMLGDYVDVAMKKKKLINELMTINSNIAKGGPLIFLNGRCVSFTAKLFKAILQNAKHDVISKIATGKIEVDEFSSLVSKISYLTQTIKTNEEIMARIDDAKKKQSKILEDLERQAGDSDEKNEKKMAANVELKQLSVKYEKIAARNDDQRQNLAELKQKYMNFSPKVLYPGVPKKAVKTTTDTFIIPSVAPDENLTNEMGKLIFDEYTRVLILQVDETSKFMNLMGLQPNDFSSIINKMDFAADFQ